MARKQMNVRLEEDLIAAVDQDRDRLTTNTERCSRDRYIADVLTEHFTQQAAELLAQIRGDV